MKNRADYRIPGYSAAHVAALEALTAANLALNQAAQDLARMIARERGIRLDKPPPAKPRTRGKYRYSRLIQNAPGIATLEVVRDDTGEMKHFRITRDADGSIGMEEL